MLYAPGLRDIETIRAVCSAVKKPVNIVMTYGDPKLTVAGFGAAGVVDPASAARSRATSSAR